ncbi:MAG TPA: LytTR family transcriptional regulator [Bacteroidales bacterium]|nr:LytTR family transcriptional regulator [Bacteroidales bacterium]
MPDLQKPIAPYLIEKRNIINLILFTALFALVFINIYSPFGADKWFNLTRFQFFTYSSLVILAGVLVVVVSRIIMYQVCKRRLINLGQFLIWIAAEVLAMALFYSLFEKFVLNDARDFVYLVKMSARNTALVLLLPYSVAWLYLSWRDKKEQIRILAEGQSPDPTPGMIPFYDDKSVLKLSVKKESLLYLEATENYITVCYLNKGKVSKYLLRATMKRMEESFAGTGIIRCHRSYMVNFEKVKVIRRDKDNLKLELDQPDVTDIPLSKTYLQNVMQTFARYSE